MSKSFCVIPARSGSKGLKDKNILDLNGMPVLAYSIKACEESGLFEDVYVATDSEEYAEIAKKYGGKVPFLEPKDMAGDFVSSLDPVLYFYEKLNVECDYIWCMQPTSPLRSKEDIINAYNVLEQDEKCQFVLSTTEIDPHYFHWALIDDEDGMSNLYFGKEMLVDRSELKDTVYRPNGAIKVGRCYAVLKQKNYFGNNIKRVEMPEERSIHIRTENDLAYCRYLLQKEKR